MLGGLKSHRGEQVGANPLEDAVLRGGRPGFSTSHQMNT